MVDKGIDVLAQAIAEMRADMAWRFGVVEERLGHIEQPPRRGQPRNYPSPRHQNLESDDEREPDGDELEPKPPDRYPMIRSYAMPWTNEPQNTTKWMETKYSFYEGGVGENYEELLPRQTFSGHVEGPNVFLRWEKAMKNWFWLHNIPEEAKLSYAEETLMGEAYMWWEQKVTYRAYYNEPVFTWDDMMWLMYNEFVKNAPAQDHRYTKNMKSTRNLQPSIRVKEVQKESIYTPILELQGTPFQYHKAAKCVPNEASEDESVNGIIKEKPPYQATSQHVLLTKANKRTDTLHQEHLGHKEGSPKKKLSLGRIQNQDPSHVQGASTPMHAPIREPQVSSVEHMKNYLSQNQTDGVMTPKLCGVVSRDHGRVNDFFQLKEEPPDAPHITKPTPYRGKTLASQNRMKANFLSLGADCTISRSKFLEGGGYDADIKPITSTTHHGVNMTDVEYMAKYTKDKGETNFLGEHIKDKGETIFGDVFQLPKLNNKSNIKLHPSNSLGSDVYQESSTIAPEKTYAPRIAQTKCEDVSTISRTNGDTFLAQLELTSKKNKHIIRSHERDIKFTSHVIPKSSNLDRCAFKRDLRADQDEPNNEATCFGNLMLNGRSGSWNHVNIFLESEDMIFTTQVNLNSPGLDLCSLFGTSRSNHKELGCKPTRYGILIEKQSSTNWNHTKPVLDVKVIQFLTQRFVGLLHLDVPELGTSQSHVWRPGDIQAFLRSLLRSLKPNKELLTAQGACHG